MYLASFVDYVVMRLVQRPEEVRISRTETGDLIEFRIAANPADMGRIIGKHGRTIGAIRTLANTAAARTGKRATVEIDDPQPSIPATPADEPAPPPPAEA